MDYTFSKSFNPGLKQWEITVTGEIDIFNSNDFKESLMSLIKETPTDLRIDCCELKYIDSTALGSLVAVLKNVKGYGGEVYLAKVKPNLAKLFKITNLDKVFIIEGVANE